MKPIDVLRHHVTGAVERGEAAPMSATRKPKKRIDGVTFVRELDTDPDTSWIGEYSSTPGADDVTVDRQERGDMSRGEFHYFIAALSATQTGNPESVEQDYNRLEALNRGDWCFIGVSAIARVVIGDTVQKIRSGGLWGIESDSSADHFEELKREQLSELAVQLEALGFSKRAIRKALADCTDAE